MAVSIPQVVTEDRASGALVIDGSLRFDESKGQYLKFTPSASGNRRTQTLSVWIKNTYTGSENKVILGGGDNASGPRYNIFYNPSRRFGVTQNPTGAQNDTAATVGVFRDYSGWQHLVVSLDCTLGQDKAQVRIYVNGKLQENGDYAGGGSAVYITDQDGIFNTINKRMYLGHYAANPSDSAEFDGYMSQYYWIDGLALGPEYFAYEDPLTNTWRPKKFRAEGTTVNDGTEWSSGASGFASNAPHGFNGNATNYSNSGAGGATYTLPKAISGRLFIKASTAQPGDGTTTATITLSDGTSRSTTVGYNNKGEFLDFGEVSNITTISDDGSADNQGVLYWVVQLDGVVMEDNATENLDFGTNGVYLPFDGNTPIGQDQSGKGNDYTPVNFGGSADITKATGAFPILNTLGGTVARAGVFGSEVSANYTTTSNTAAGSGYEFDQTSGFNPSLSFVRGATYTFDYTDSSSHPLRFSSTDPDSSVTSYTDGTNTSVSNTVKITVPHNAPDTLYYYCTSHNSMNGRISVTTDTKKADPYAWKNVLAVPLVGGANDVSASIACTSTPKAATVNGAVASTVQSNFYGGSYLFDGSNDYISYATSTELDFGSGACTVEAWLYIDSHGGDKTIVGTWTGNISWQLTYGSTASQNKFCFMMYDGSTTTAESDVNSTDYVDKWVHVCGQRTGNTLQILVDGKLAGTASFSGSHNTLNAPVQVGGRADSYGFVTGNIQDVRIYKGIAKYSVSTVGDQAFIPASTNPDILPDTPSGVATKTQLTKITDGAVSFDGTGDELNLSGHSDLAFGTGNFTIECFAYFNSFDDTYPTVLSKLVGGTLSWIVRVKNDGKLVWYSKNGSGTNNESSTSPIVLKKWHHIAVVREGTGSNQLKGYIDGKVVLTMTDSNDYNDSNDLCIGTQQSGGGNTINGFISNVRLIKGTALYTSNFTPPTRTLTNVSNTKLLCCQSNTSAAIAAVTPNVPGSGINDGTIWSAGVSASTGSIVDAGLGFDGSTSTAAYASSSASDTYIYIDFSTALSGTFKLWTSMASGSPTAIVTHNGGTTSVNLSSGENSLGTFTSVTRIAVNRGEAATHSFNAIAVDDVQLLDPVAVAGDAAATTFNPFTTDINTVRGQEGSYCTWNPLDTKNSPTLSNGNLRLTTGATIDWQGAFSTIEVSSGKWYFETTCIEVNTGSGASGTGAAIAVRTKDGTGANTNDDYTLRYTDTGYVKNGNSASGNVSVSGNTALGDVIGIAFDADLGSYNLYINGIQVSSGSFSFANYTAGDALRVYTAAYPDSGGFVYGNLSDVNFGQKPFKFPPPDGFQPLTSSTVRPDTVITRPDQYFGTTLYSGNSGDGLSTTQDIDVGLNPDLIWIKHRNGTNSNLLTDTVRGLSNQLISNSTAGHNTNASRIPELIYNGFRVGDRNEVNDVGGNYVAWCWKAGGSSNTFNIDDVGYVNASDVNMSVGSLNSATIDQSQVWSNDISGTPYNSSFPVTQAFDGNVNTDTMATDNNTLTWTPSTPITGSVIRFRLLTEGTSASFTINGIAQYPSFRTSSPVEGWHTFSGTTVTEVTWQRLSGTSQIRLSAVEVDGKILVDQGVTPQNVPSIPATGCSVGTKQGFSIIKYTGNASDQATLPHGLEQIPDFIICKNLGTIYNWFIWHNEFGNGANAAIYFTDAAKADGFSTLPFASLSNKVITFNNNNGVNGSSNYIMYAWHNVPGLQKFGSYESNSNGVFVELGFRPALLVVKNMDATLTNSQWNVVDTQRDTYNPSLNNLAWNRTNTEPAVSASTYGIDIVSNGFHIPSGNNGEAINNTTATQTYIYAAWAEAPAFNLYGAQSNAR